MRALLAALLPLTLAHRGAGPQVVPAPTFLEPYAPLNDGAFVGPPLAFHPDPLGNFVWQPSVNASALQIYALLPSSVALTPDTPAGSFANASSLLAPLPSVLVSGVGGLQLDFGVESAAWIEFESSDLRPADVAGVQLSVSEYDEYEITNLGAKVGTPVAHARGDGVTMYRLELPHPDLYEGVRFAWLRVNATPSAPWHISALRLVCQIKPTNWGGAFAAAGDDGLSRIWYLGAYTVKVNLLADQFGSILIYRGDRFSWTGDAHVAQQTAMAALGNFGFVAQNLRFTQANCNGIESYCLYFCLSVANYYQATNDTALIGELTAAVDPKLEHAHDVWGTKVALGFEGWDDRLGSGFNGARDSAEAQADYRMLAIRAWRAWAGVLAALGNATGAAHFNGYADAAVAATRAPGAAWYAPLGLFASAGAINAGVATPAEAAALVSAHFNDSTTICSLAPFNTYFLLGALAAAGELDRGLATVHACWDVMVHLGATTTWETAKPHWEDFTREHGGVAGFEDGFTSMAHPWSSGATAWATAHLAGVRATTPGFATYVVAPHVAGAMNGVAATVPLPGGESIRVRATAARAGAHVCVDAPRAGRAGVLELSELLVARLTGGVAGAADAAVFHAAAAACACEEEPAGSDDDAFAARAGEEQLPVAPLSFDAARTGPVDPATGERARVARVALRAGGCTRVALRAAVSAAAAAPANPFPPPAWPAALVGVDRATQGAFVGTYGSAGHYLVAFDGPAKPVVALPPWVSAVSQTWAQAEQGPWLDPPPAADARALQDPRAPEGARAIGQWCSTPTQPSFPIDVAAQPAPPGSTYQYSVYFCDYDARGRRATVQLMDLETFADISPVQSVSDFEGGVWLVWQYPRGVRLRVNFVRGTNAVISAVLFDVVNTTAV